MYDYINGPISELTPTAAVIEAGGVGYFINISLQTHRIIASAERAKLYVHMYVVQMEAPVFYGFATAIEREMFRLLISISGIGANTARVMLSTYSTEELGTMIATGNSAAIQKTKGIGAKTAERVVLELKDKILKVISRVQSSSEHVDVDFINKASMNEAIEALMVLGFNKSAVEKVIQKIFSQNPTTSTEDFIREALGQL